VDNVELAFREALDNANRLTLRAAETDDVVDKMFAAYARTRISHVVEWERVKERARRRMEGR
jgi:hypothetical protein